MTVSGLVWAMWDYMGLSELVLACQGLSGFVLADLGLSGLGWSCMGLSELVWACPGLSGLVGKRSEKWLFEWIKSVLNC